MQLYSTRHLGSKPRTEEDISYKLWKAIVALLEKLEQKNFFSEAYPEGCCDDSSIVCGTDINKLNTEIELHTDLSWPLRITKDSEGYWPDKESYIPTKYEIFNLLELLYHRTSTPENGQYHSYGRHYHLHFPPNNNAKTIFSDELNNLFSATGSIYELNPSNGQIENIIGEDTRNLIRDALSQSLIMDAEYCEMLQTACSRITNARLDVAYGALEKLWDAYEQLKCYFEPQNQKQKSLAIDKIIELFAENTFFQNEINEEMKKLTVLGNNLRIRHSETYQFTLNNHRQINYLFKRCLAMIVLIQEQLIVYGNK
ncbi:AbiJ-NTD4 domain-containing protein [Acinetobacter pittii]|uniref:AbiJ-NTD4 domain-containing protein n=1 Tax=Acinetobacter pittii TaxID=48296 RepID=UPI0025AF9901|nr:hypothetical protein [Acinetobacter pittii]